MADRRKVIRESSEGPFIEVGEKHIKLGFDENNFLVINSGGITEQGKKNIQGSPSDTTYYGLFKPQNEWLGSFTFGMFSAPQYNLNIGGLVEMLPGIIGLAKTMALVNRF